MPDDPVSTPDENPVAQHLGRTTLSDWMGFAKIAIPTVALAIPALLFPVEHYLDAREDAFRASLRPLSAEEVTAGDIEHIKEELEELESELKGDLRSSPTTIENMERLADLRERVVRLEAILEDRR